LVQPEQIAFGQIIAAALKNIALPLGMLVVAIPVVFAVERRFVIANARIAGVRRARTEQCVARLTAEVFRVKLSQTGTATPTGFCQRFHRFGAYRTAGVRGFKFFFCR
jgi:hypothetical protein